MGCLLVPFQFIGWAFRSGWKGIVVLVLVVILVWAGVCQVAKATSKQIPTIQQTTANDNIPSIAVAPYVVRTGNRTFLVAKYHTEGTATVLDVFWWLTKGKWVKSTNLKMTRAGYGDIRVENR